MSLGKAGITEFKSPCHAHVSFISYAHTVHKGLTVIIPLRMILKTAVPNGPNAAYM